MIYITIQVSFVAAMRGFYGACNALLFDYPSSYLGLLHFEKIHKLVQLLYVCYASVNMFTFEIVWFMANNFSLSPSPSVH